MVFRKISKDMKDRVIDLHYQGLVPQDICDLLGISPRSLSRWRHNQDLYGSSLPPPTHTAGRPRILSGEQVLSVCKQLNRAPEMYLDEIQDWVALTMQTSISKSALSMLIQDAGYSFKMLHKAASERDEEERAMFRSWADDTVTAEMVVTADESSKDNRTIFRRWGRSVRGTPAGVHTKFTRGERYSILAAISVDGYVATRIVIGAVDSDEFFDFIVSDVVRPYVSISIPIHLFVIPASKHEPLSRASKRPHPR
jgi:transposase